MGVEVHEQTIEAPPADVWGFMVDPAALSAWFGADAWLEPAVGGPVLFRFADGSVRRGVVEQVERSRMSDVALARASRRRLRHGARRVLSRDDRARAGGRGHSRAHHRVAGTATAAAS